MGCKTIGRFTYDNATAALIEENGPVPLPNQTVSTNCIKCDGENIMVNTGGAYIINANFTFVGTAVGQVETQLYRNGNPIPGAHAIDSIAAVGDDVTQSINTVITVSPRVPQATVNFRVADATSLRIANVIVTKVA